MQISRALLAASLAILGTSACASQQYPPSAEQVTDLKPYTLTFRNFKATEVLSFLSAIEHKFPGTNYVGDHEGGTTAWRQNLVSSLSSTEMHRELYEVLLSAGYSEEDLRITVREQGQVEIVKLSLTRLNQ
jgi:hypothetical protein|tara:strand:+ start:430 stop:822 length:393 start_codon:yes stop_codon:yes gene_type:complete